MKKEYLDLLIGMSKTDTHEEIEKCLTYCGKNGLRELDDDDVEGYLKAKGIVRDE